MKRDSVFLNEENPLVKKINNYKRNVVNYNFRKSYRVFIEEFDAILEYNIDQLKRLKSEDIELYTIIQKDNMDFLKSRIQAGEKLEADFNSLFKIYKVVISLERNPISLYHKVQSKYQKLALTSRKCTVPKKDMAIIWTFTFIRETEEVKSIRLNNLRKYIKLYTFINSQGFNYGTLRTYANNALSGHKDYREITEDTADLLSEKGFELGIPVKVK